MFSRRHHHRCCGSVWPSDTCLPACLPLLQPGCEDWTDARLVTTVLQNLLEMDLLEEVRAAAAADDVD